MQRDGLKIHSTTIVHEDWKVYYIRPIFEDANGNLIVGETMLSHKNELSDDLHEAI